MSNKQKFKKRKPQEYQHRSPAVCIVVYNPEGRPMPDDLADEAVDAVAEIAKREGFFISFTRT